MLNTAGLWYGSSDASSVVFPRQQVTATLASKTLWRRGEHRLMPVAPLRSPCPAVRASFHPAQVHGRPSREEATSPGKPSVTACRFGDPGGPACSPLCIHDCHCQPHRRRRSPPFLTWCHPPCRCIRPHDGGFRSTVGYASSSSWEEACRDPELNVARFVRPESDPLVGYKILQVCLQARPPISQKRRVRETSVVRSPMCLKSGIT